MSFQIYNPTFSDKKLNGYSLRCVLFDGHIGKRKRWNKRIFTIGHMWNFPIKYGLLIGFTTLESKNSNKLTKHGLSPSKRLKSNSVQGFLLIRMPKDNLCGGAKAWTLILGLKPHLLIRIRPRRSKRLKMPHRE